MEEQFTISRNRASEITISEDLTSGGMGGNYPFSGYDEFGGEMEDIRQAHTLEEEKEMTGQDTLQVFVSDNCCTGCVTHYI